MADPRRETPARLGLDLKAQRLTVTWHDGHVSAYDGAFLRFVCPCAGCTPMVCVAPAMVVAVCGAVCETPSSTTVPPVGAVARVICNVFGST